jgi:phosphoribosylformylglycinamidine cyclo-ligase
MVVCVPAAEAEKALDVLHQAGEQAWVIGQIQKATPDSPQVIVK